MNTLERLKKVEMTKTTEEVEKFIELRAKGLSFDKIAEQTGTSKPTLLKWNETYMEHIEEAQFYELQNLLFQYGVMRRNRVEVISEMLGSALLELKQRAGTADFHKMDTEKLLNFILTLEQRLEKETDLRRLEHSESKKQKYLLGSTIEVD